MKHTKILILGGGLTGLSVAYHLEQAGLTDYVLAEKEPQAGGLCASHSQNGFTYDFGGHLLHLHTPYGKALVKKLLKNNLARLKRSAWIDTENALVPYPYQASLFALPEAEKQACLRGLKNRPFYKHPRTFKQWCLTAFGDGIYRQFLAPYNTKLWGLPPEKLTCEWCGPFVPRPTQAQIRQSAARPTQTNYGYNAFFYYPKQGGIGALANALTDHVSHLQTNTAVKKVDLTRQLAWLNGEKISFDYLVNTLPLPQFIGLLVGQEKLKKQAQKLTARAVTVWNVGLSQQTRKKFSWIYFPSPKIPFFRVGLQSGFSAANAPKGNYLLYIELAGKKSLTAALQKQILNTLFQKGIIKEVQKPVFSTSAVITYGYAVYDKNRTPVVSCLQKELEKQRVFCAGRYGNWEYSFMEKSLLDGRDTARKILSFLTTERI